MQASNQTSKHQKEKLRCLACGAHFKYVYTLDQKGHTFECLGCQNRYNFTWKEIQPFKVLLYPGIAAIFFLVTGFLEKIFNLTPFHEDSFFGLATIMFGICMVAWSAKWITNGVVFNFAKYECGNAQLLYRDKNAFFWVWVYALWFCAFIFIIFGLIALFFAD